jgi:hypothetical protein
MMKYFLPGQKKEFRLGKIRAFLYGFVIAALLFTGLGYAWRMVQTDGPHKEEIAKLKTKIDHYRNNWTPIRAKEAQKR